MNVPPCSGLACSSAGTRSLIQRLQQALRLAAVFAVIKLAIQVATNFIAPHFGYGYFRDELYYLICARHLDWGYVDQPPLVALQARAAVALFGDSIAGIRMLSAFAGALKVFLTGLLAWSLGGRRTAQVLAMVAVIAAPVYLGADGFLSMNSFEPVFWMGCVLALILLARGDNPRWWLAVGLLGGLGLENKHSTTFFLFAVLFALLVTPQRRLLWNKWLFLAILLIVGIALPNLIWEARHHWATYELLNNIKHGNRNVVLGPVPFMLRQMLIMNPFAAPLWIAGLLWLLRFAENEERAICRMDLPVPSGRNDRAQGEGLLCGADLSHALGRRCGRV